MTARWLLAMTLCTWSAPGASAAAGAPAEWRMVRIVVPEGPTKCYNYSRSFGLWGTIATPKRPGCLLLRDGDILAVRRAEGKDDELVFTTYRETDGPSLSFEFDGHRLLLGGKVVALRLAKEKEGWEWLDAATLKEAASLRFVTIDDKVEAPRLPTVTKLAAMNPTIDLAVDDDDAFLQVLPLLAPRRVVAPGVSLDAERQKALLSQVNLEVLYVGIGKSPEVGFAAFLPRLRRLVIAEWKPSRVALFPWGCRRLRSLALIKCDLKSLATIEHLTELRELHLVECSDLADVSALRRMPRLEALTLCVDDKVTGLSALEALPSLTWLSLASKLERGRFEALVRAVPRLTALELLGSEDIKDLAPLRDLERLRYLALVGTKAEWPPLHEMKGLRLVLLPYEAFEKAADRVAALAKALPDCTLAAAAPCLGSGWILLLVPVVAAGWFLARRRSRRHNPGAHHG